MFFPQECGLTRGKYAGPRRTSAVDPRRQEKTLERLLKAVGSLNLGEVSFRAGKLFVGDDAFKCEVGDGHVVMTPSEEGPKPCHKVVVEVPKRWKTSWGSHKFREVLLHGFKTNEAYERWLQRSGWMRGIRARAESLPFELVLPKDCDPNENVSVTLRGKWMTKFPDWAMKHYVRLWPSFMGSGRKVSMKVSEINPSWLELTAELSPAEVKALVEEALSLHLTHQVLTA